MAEVEYVLSNDAGKPVTYSLPRVEDAARDAWSRVAAGGRQTLLLYVHGRDRKLDGRDGEPGSSFKEGIVAELEEHQAAVLMLHWPHSMGVFDLYGYPEAHAFAAAAPLNRLLKAVQSAKPGGSMARVIVVTHSMGALVVQKMVTDNLGAPLAGISSVVLSSAAIRLAGSGNWLRQVPTRVFVMLNRDDGTLKDAETHNPELGALLGRQSAQSLPAAETAANVRYLDVTPLAGIGHRYFVRAGSHSDEASLQWLRARCFDKLYAGLDPDPAHYLQPDPDLPVFVIRTP